MISADYAQVMGDGLTRIITKFFCCRSSGGAQQHQPTAPSVTAHRRRQAASTGRANEALSCFIAPATHATKKRCRHRIGILNTQQSIKQINGTRKHTTINQINERKAPLSWD
jgi:hypothetical protein